jgi:hypothetical protein
VAKAATPTYEGLAQYEADLLADAMRWAHPYRHKELGPCVNTRTEYDREFQRTQFDNDPYYRNHGRAEDWLAQHGQPVTEAMVRAWQLVHYGGHKALAGAGVRGFRERLLHPKAQVGEGYRMGDDDPDVYLRCPYRRSLHGGASPGGGTWGHIYANAWGHGVWAANQLLRWRAEGVPIEHWGKDHWSTFAYAAHVATSDKDSVIEPDRMRTDGNRHPHGVGYTKRMLGTDTTAKLYPTRLRQGQLLLEHDDWDCLDDAVHAGLMTWGTWVNPFVVLTTKGLAAQARINELQNEGKRWPEMYGWVPPTTVDEAHPGDQMHKALHG